MGKTYPWPANVIICVSIIGLALYIGVSNSEQDTFLDASAQFERGLVYYCGDGVPVDYAEAAEWFRKAAEQGDVAGQCNLGVMYAEGRGVQRDDAQAIQWFRKAAKQGNTEARTSLDEIEGQRAKAK